MPLQIANLEAIKAIGRSDVFLKLEMGKKILEICILIISVFINVYAIAIGVIVYNFICVFINTYPNNKLIGYTLKQLCRDIIPALTVSCLMGVFIYTLLLLPISYPFMLILQIILGIMIYLAMCIAFKIESFYYIKQIIFNRNN